MNTVPNSATKSNPAKAVRSVNPEPSLKFLDRVLILPQKAHRYREFDLVFLGITGRFTAFSLIE